MDTEQPDATVQPLGRVALLDEILALGNDNDPRLDTAFNNLTDEEKDAFEQRYRELPQARYNQRGTVVYILARDLETVRDAEFLGRVLSEASQLDINDASPVDQRTEAYPQLVALMQIANFFQRQKAGRARRVFATLAAEVRRARGSPVHVIAKLAETVPIPNE